MSIIEKSDSEILSLALPMINDVVQASNNKDWPTFSKYQRLDEAQDPANQQHVAQLWQNQPLFTSLSLDREILGVLRRGDVAEIVWKQTSTQVSGDYLARYLIAEIEGDIKEVGFVIN
ncbi:hypothetical protein BGP77_06650 [Saccharospirillum sp. MSK14-1]|uniref:hypothetical protein n=1 Tax=Saccharospirillum sp. MSK14-1 TaxID=1897632 RepID=UPI000D3B9F94|nr:hypothetical protein [Saccharospirillum sp. MSK14-1]PTY36959.1 hypothetical protein BGP77_06650 [Saccharospirillum sp. MSK14-1]